ncbi:MAG: GNAT family N-acetyltransferase [Cypionkella sp.]
MIVRAATLHDAAAMAVVLNRIIEIGGTTAHLTPKSAQDIAAQYIDGEATLTCVVAEVEGAIIGWQAIGWWQGVGHIGSFVSPDTQAKGTGAALFALTCELARGTGLREIYADIRADNVPGLAYYARIGFVDIGSDADFALTDGRVVGRVQRRFDLT